MSNDDREIEKTEPTDPERDKGQAPAPDDSAIGTGTDPAGAGEEETGEFSLEPPEGIDPDSESWREFVEAARDLRLAPEAAERLLGLHRAVIRQMEEQIEQQRTQAEELAATWEKAVRDDPELGGSRLKETTQLAALAVEHYGDRDFRELLDATGLGNHPVLVRVFRDLGRRLAEDAPAAGPAPAGRTRGPEDLYPTMRK